METFFRVLNICLFTACSAGLIRLLYQERWGRAALSGIMLSIFAYMLFFYR